MIPSVERSISNPVLLNSLAVDQRRTFTPLSFCPAKLNKETGNAIGSLLIPKGEKVVKPEPVATVPVTEPLL